jgi:ABC-type Zn uptake system ZnuABC Zn-binding protein ZnuA
VSSRTGRDSLADDGIRTDGEVLAAGEARPFRIIAGSTYLADIARELLGSGTVVLTLASPETSPKATDLKAADAAFVADAHLVLVHGFQADQALFSELVRSSGNGSLRMAAVRAAGSWQVPDAQRQASEETAGVLAEAFPGHAGLLRVRLARRLKAIDALETEAHVLAGPLRGLPIAASEIQAWFLKWAGMEVTWSFGASGTPAGLPAPPPPVGLKVEFVVGDLQTGDGAGAAVARELEVPLVVLSSFPGAPEDSPDYFSLVRGNLRRLLSAGGAPDAGD